MNILLNFFSSSQASIIKKRRFLLQILELRRKRKVLIDAIQKRDRQRNLWTKVRTNTFWEREMLVNDDDYFKQHFRTSRRTFDILCNELRDLEDKDLYELQKNKWDPVIEWFIKRFDTNIQKTPSISQPTVSDADKMKISKYFLSHSEDVLYGFFFAVDTIKSIILSCAVIEQHISADKAVTLARLEEEFQLGTGGMGSGHESTRTTSSLGCYPLLTSTGQNNSPKSS